MPASTLAVDMGAMVRVVLVVVLVAPGCDAVGTPGMIDTTVVLLTTGSVVVIAGAVLVVVLSPAVAPVSVVVGAAICPAVAVALICAMASAQPGQLGLDNTFTEQGSTE